MGAAVAGADVGDVVVVGAAVGGDAVWVGAGVVGVEVGAGVFAGAVWVGAGALDGGGALGVGLVLDGAALDGVASVGSGVLYDGGVALAVDAVVGAAVAGRCGEAVTEAEAVGVAVAVCIAATGVAEAFTVRTMPNNAAARIDPGVEDFRSLDAAATEWLPAAAPAGTVNRALNLPFAFASTDGIPLASPSHVS